MEIQTVHSVKLLLALLVPLIGTLGVMFVGKNENLREGVSSAASIILLLIVASMTRDVWDGKILEYHMFTVLPGLKVTLRADGMSMIFALVASSLWTIAVFYS
ncbi:MAG TPA: monovalent cation/H+ antiporter subunit D family protein, partial [Desulfobacterales bacterium]|nr:monovalent cation/H+ antiporter subunit D family protein [Desulfobacterales bacterium]